MFNYQAITLRLTSTYLDLTVENTFHERLFYAKRSRKIYIRFYTALVETALLETDYFLHLYYEMKNLLSE